MNELNEQQDRVSPNRTSDTVRLLTAEDLLSLNATMRDSERHCQRGVNIPEFCKQFDAATPRLDTGSPIPTVITVYADRSFRSR